MHRSRVGLAIWLVVSAILVVVFSLVVAHAPQPFKRLGLTYAAFGLMSGLFLRWFAGEQQLSTSVKLGVIAGLFTIAGSINIGWQSFIQFAEVRANELREHPEQLAMLNMMKSLSGEEASEEYESRRRELQPEFVDYLRFRVSQLGAWQPSSAIAFWSAEVLIAAVLSGLIVSGLIFRDQTIQSASAKQTADDEVESDL